jgi:hypothetical protein
MGVRGVGVMLARVLLKKKLSPEEGLVFVRDAKKDKR